MGIGRIMAIEAGRGIDGHNWSGSYWDSTKTSTGFSTGLQNMSGLTPAASRHSLSVVAATAGKHVFHQSPAC